MTLFLSGGALFSDFVFTEVLMVLRSHVVYFLGAVSQ